MLAKKILFFAALIVAVFLTWFVMDTVSDIPTIKQAVSSPSAPEPDAISRLHEAYNKQCVVDSDCMIVPASCQSCNCNFEAIAAKGSETYGQKRAEICKGSSVGMKATCDMYCPKKAACVEQKCTIQSLNPAAQ